jgi:guanylate kinase
VIVGPSGVGKGTVVRKLLERDPSIWLSVSATTRAPRPGEVDGVDYRFVSPEEFEALRSGDGLLEAFEVFGHWYGTARAPVEEHLAAGQDVMLEIDVQGALAVREAFPDAALLVFVRPPSREEQRRRLVERGVDDPAEIERRLAAAATEEAQAGAFDAVVVNDDVDAAVDRVAGTLMSRRLAQ